MSCEFNSLHLVIFIFDFALLKSAFLHFVMLIELVSVRVLLINLNQIDIGIHSSLTVLQAPTGCHVATC